MDPEDQVTMPSYNATLRTVYTWREGIGIEEIQPEGPPPYVRAQLAIGGRVEDGRPGMEVAGPDGTVFRNIGGGGVIWSDGRGLGRSRQGVRVRWGPDGLPPALEGAQELTLRYYYPSAALVVQEEWPLDSGQWTACHETLSSGPDRPGVEGAGPAAADGHQ